MTVYGDLDVSVIDELPPGRTPVKTVVCGEDKRAEFIKRERGYDLEAKRTSFIRLSRNRKDGFERRDADIALRDRVFPHLRLRRTAK